MDFNIPDYDKMTEEEKSSLNCKYQFAIDNPNISFKIDHVYIFPER